MDIELNRDLAIALNSIGWMAQEPVCRLAADPARWLATSKRDLPEVASRCGVSVPQLRAALSTSRRCRRAARLESRKARNAGAKILTLWDDGYPPALLDLELPPPVLYIRGDLDLLAAPSVVSIVGSRKADPYGLEVAEQFAADLAASGLVVASGLALGIDSAAHRGALTTGTTIAVLGCGIDIDYPRSNRSLSGRIADKGVIVTEFPIGAEPEPQRFPIRNRIIAALGLGTLVVRGTRKSGSLITAGHALALGKLVWAVPGNIFDPRSKGPNSLIRDGAHPVQGARDILETLPVTIQCRLELVAPTPAKPERRELRELLSLIPAGEPQTQHDLIHTSRLPIERLLSLLMELEIGGWLKRYAGPSWGHAGPTQRAGRDPS